MRFRLPFKRFPFSSSIVFLFLFAASGWSQVPQLEILPVRFNDNGGVQLKARLTNIAGSQRQDFRSAHIDGLLCWFAADDLNGNFIDDTVDPEPVPESPIQSWMDRTGNSLALNFEPALSPTLVPVSQNGLPTVSFGSPDELWLDAPVAGETVFLVHRFEGEKGVPDTVLGQGIELSDAAGMRQLRHSNGISLVSGSDSRQMAVTCLQYSPGNQLLAVDGSLIGLSEVPGRLGSLDSIGNGFSGDLAEILVYNRWLSHDERNVVEGYLAHKWGLVNHLPIAHPYAVNPPVSPKSLDVTFYWGSVDGGTSPEAWVNSQTTLATRDGIVFVNTMPDVTSDSFFYKASVSDGTQQFWSAGDSDFFEEISEEESDNDLDGLPNAWELINGLDPMDPTDALLDLDGDGQDNVSEFVAGTDPRVVGSNFRIKRWSRTQEGSYRLYWDAVPGKSYQVECSFSPSGPIWNILSMDGEAWFSRDTAGELYFDVSGSVFEFGFSSYYRVVTRNRGRKPNVIFILTDDQGFGDLAAYAHPYIKTPALDRLAAEGTRFNKYYNASPVCSPSRAAIFTGKTPSSMAINATISGSTGRNAANNSVNLLPVDVHNLASVFRSGGYRTAHFGKWHLGSATRVEVPSPTGYGFDRSLAGLARGAQLTNSIYATPSDPDEPEVSFRSRSTDIIVSEALDFLGDYRDQPVFLQLWTLVPHATLEPSEAELAVYNDLTVTPELFNGEFRDYLAAAPDLDSQMRTYLAAVTGMDTALQRLFDGIRELGIEEDTIIVFTSDNGPETYTITPGRNAGVGSTGWLRMRKRAHYNGGIRAPLIVKWTGTIPENRVDASSEIFACDFLPTLCNLVGIAVPEDFEGHGEDVSDIFLGTAREREKPMFLGYPSGASNGMSYGIIDGGWKLLTNADDTVFELYNLDEDPGELENLAQERLEILADLYFQLATWRLTLPPGPEE